MLNLEVDEKKADRLLKKIIILEKTNLKTKQKNRKEMVKEILKKIEEELECY